VLVNPDGRVNVQRTTRCRAIEVFWNTVLARGDGSAWPAAIGEPSASSGRGIWAADRCDRSGDNVVGAGETGAVLRAVRTGDDLDLRRARASALFAAIPAAICRKLRGLRRTAAGWVVPVRSPS
jgi:hypothetical protein